MNETVAQYEARLAAWAKTERHELDNGCLHDVWVQREIGLPGALTSIAPVVRLANDDDGHYVQTFRARAEVDAFVARLAAAADEAWPTSPALPQDSGSAP